MKRKAFRELLRVAKWALRKHYTAQESRLIERSFKTDPAEIICIAARDLSNDIRAEIKKIKEKKMK